MKEYEMQILIEELQKLVVALRRENNGQKYEITNLKSEVERLENLLTPKIEN